MIFGSAKINHVHDLETFDDKFWFELEIDNPSKYSSASNLKDFIEFKYKIPSIPCDMITLTTVPASIGAGYTVTCIAKNITATITGVKNGIFVLDKTGLATGDVIILKDQSGVTIGTTFTINQVGNTPSLTGYVNDAVTYKTITGQVFTGYKQFQIKIGLVSDNSAIVPRVTDLRCMALQM